MSKQNLTSHSTHNRLFQRWSLHVKLNLILSNVIQLYRVLSEIKCSPVRENQISISSSMNRLANESDGLQLHSERWHWQYYVTASLPEQICLSVTGKVRLLTGDFSSCLASSELDLRQYCHPHRRQFRPNQVQTLVVSAPLRKTRHSVMQKETRHRSDCIVCVSIQCLTAWNIFPIAAVNILLPSHFCQAGSQINTVNTT